jgi:hypothetical protein
MRWYTVTAATICLAASFSCGGDGETRSPIPEDPGGSSNLVGSFTPEQANPGDGSVAMALADSNGSLVVVAVTVTGVNDLFSADFEVTYDPQMADFYNWSVGTILETGGNDPSYMLTATQPGLVTIGATRTGGGSGGVDVGATQTLINLVFQVTEPGSSSVALQRASLLDAQDPPQPIPRLSWHGGTLTGN